LIDELLVQDATLVAQLETQKFSGHLLNKL